ncbi:uncharacterized protein LOC143284161 [Babylonia areolata]|uniref:uncharacterized protein LOC143284161 n=1 Tax=Babylonia areolata TaxID=304850 RepID=UPI003FCF6D27
MAASRQQGQQSPVPSTSSAPPMALDDSVSVSHNLVHVEVNRADRPSLRSNMDLNDSGDSSDITSQTSLYREKGGSTRYKTRADHRTAVKEEPLDHWLLVKTMVFIILLAASVATVMFGITYLHTDCPLVDDLPVFLISIGVALTLRLAVLLRQWTAASGCQRCQITRNGRVRPLDLAGHYLDVTVLVLALIEGLKVYQAFSQADYEDPKAKVFCDPILFRFSFWFLTATLGATLLAIMVTLLLTCC